MNETIILNEETKKLNEIIALSNEIHETIYFNNLCSLNIDYEIIELNNMYIKLCKERLMKILNRNTSVNNNNQHNNNQHNNNNQNNNQNNNNNVTTEQHDNLTEQVENLTDNFSDNSTTEITQYERLKLKVYALKPILILKLLIIYFVNFFDREISILKSVLIFSILLIYYVKEIYSISFMFSYINVIIYFIFFNKDNNNNNNNNSVYTNDSIFMKFLIISITFFLSILPFWKISME